MREMSRPWVPPDDKCHQTPFRTGVDEALLEAFPPVVSDPLPVCIAIAIQALEREEETKLED